MNDNVSRIAHLLCIALHYPLQHHKKRKQRLEANHAPTYNRLPPRSLEVNMSDSAIFSQMHIQPVLIISYTERPVTAVQVHRPIRIEILRDHTPMLNDPMLLGQILLREALNLPVSFTPATTATDQTKRKRMEKLQKKRTVVSDELSVSFFPTSLFIQSSCWLPLLEPPELMRPGTTRGMVALLELTCTEWKVMNGFLFRDLFSRCLFAGSYSNR